MMGEIKLLICLSEENLWSDCFVNLSYILKLTVMLCNVCGYGYMPPASVILRPY